MVLDVSEYIFWDQADKNYAFEDYNFVLPDISIGNVGQLTVDLLLNNLEVEHLGRINHHCFFPFIGGDPFHPESTRLASSCEIYECKGKKLVILQIRSRVFPNRFIEFRDLIVQFIKKFNFKQTVMVASSSSEYFSAGQLQSIPVHYLETSKSQNKEAFSQLKWKEFSFPDNVDTTIITPIPGSFVSASLLENCEKESIPFVILICVCSEGNNYPEALHTVGCINSWLNLKQVNDSVEPWKMPVSWNLPYGNAAPHTIY